MRSHWIRTHKRKKRKLDDVVFALSGRTHKAWSTEVEIIDFYGVSGCSDAISIWIKHENAVESIANKITSGDTKEDLATLWVESSGIMTLEFWELEHFDWINAREGSKTDLDGSLRKCFAIDIDPRDLANIKSRYF